MHPKTQNSFPSTKIKCVKRPTDKEDFGDTNLVGWAKIKVSEGKQLEVIINTDLLLEIQGGTNEAEVKEVIDTYRQLIWWWLRNGMRRHCWRKWVLSFRAQTVKERTNRGRRRKEQREEEEGKIGF